MPNRKTFDEREKYDHSGHPVGEPQPSDLAPDVPQSGDRRVEGDAVSGAEPDPARAREHARRGEPVREQPAAADAGGEGGGQGGEARASTPRHQAGAHRHST